MRTRHKRGGQRQRTTKLPRKIINLAFSLQEERERERERERESLVCQRPFVTAYCAHPENVPRSFLALSRTRSVDHFLSFLSLFLSLLAFLDNRVRRQVARVFWRAFGGQWNRDLESGSRSTAALSTTKLSYGSSLLSDDLPLRRRGLLRN